MAVSISSPLLQPVTVITSSSFILNWSSVQGVEKYKLFVARSQTEIVQDETVVDVVLSNFHPGYNGKIVEGTRWEVTNLLPSTTYYVRIISLQGSLESVGLQPTIVSTVAQPVRVTARGLRVDFAFMEWAATSYRNVLYALDNLLYGATEKDNVNYPIARPTFKDIQAIVPFKVNLIQDPTLDEVQTVPKASSYLTIDALRRVKNFKGKITSVLNKLTSEFASFVERSTSSITQANPKFPNPYALLGIVTAQEYYVKDKVGAQAVPVQEDDFGYWEKTDYSPTETGITNQVYKPKPIIYDVNEVPTPPEVKIDYLRVGSTFNIAITAEGQGGLQNRPSSTTVTDTGFMIVITTPSEPGRRYYVRAER